MIKTSKKQKIFIVLFILITVVCLLFIKILSIGFWHDDYHYRFSLEETRIVIDGYHGEDEYVEIPTHLGPFKVSLTSGVYDNNSIIKKIFVPMGLSEGYVFNNCSNLHEVEFEQGITSINTRFKKCYNLEKVIIPESVTEIGVYAFASCKNVSDVKIPTSVKYIGLDAFYNTNFETQHADNKYYIVGDGILLFYNGPQDCIVIPKGIRQCNHLYFEDKETCYVYYPETVTDAYLYIPKNVVAYFGDEAINFRAIDDYQYSAGLFVAPAGSYVEEYCKENNLKFRPMTEEEEKEWREKTEAAASEITYQEE